MAEDPDSAHSEASVALVSNMTGIWLGGGEPWRLAAALMVEEGGARVDSPVMAAVRAVLGRGGLLGGTSAGAEAMTDLGLVTGGESWEALVGDTFYISTYLLYLPLGVGLHGGHGHGRGCQR